MDTLFVVAGSVIAITVVLVSLAIVEQIAQDTMPDTLHAALIRPDPQRGEQIVLFSQNADMTRDALLQAARTAGVSELAVPKKLINIKFIPVLGTGKIDYVTLQAENP